MKFIILLVVMIGLNGCASNKSKEEAICTSDGAYATGYNDGSSNDDMVPNFAMSKCGDLSLSDTEINNLNQRYISGYKNGKGGQGISQYRNNNVRPLRPNRRIRY